MIYGREAATLELKIPKGKVRRGDLLSVSNKTVTAGLEEMVEAWFKEARFKRKK